MPNSEKEAKSMDEKLAAYKERLISQSMRPPRAEKSQEERIKEQLEKSEIMLGKANHRRILLLLSQAKIRANTEDYQAVHGLCGEVAHLCRVEIVGLAELYPAVAEPRRLLYSAAAESRRLPTLPPGEDEPP